MDPITAFIVNLIIGIILSVASTLIQQATQQDRQQKVAGVRGSEQEGADNPLAFIMGFYGTPGQFEYHGSWGEVDETPNAYYSKATSFSDIPVEAITGLFVNGEKATINAVSTPGLGYPIDEFTVDGVEHMWIRKYDGTQVAADTLLTARFGTDPDHPWLSTHIGVGIAYAVITTLVNRELFIGIPKFMFEVEGIKLYDPREDTTAGGSGSQRLNNPATWAWSDNPIVAIYNILLGIYYDDEWVFGPQTITQARLPYANWAAQMNKCDVLVAKAGGGTEKRFRFGLEVSAEEEPHAVIGELLKACQGRIAEIGGIYKVLVGEPGAAVKSFTDEDIVISAGQTYEPFPGLESTYNAITATYPEPLEAWENKDAPPRYNTALEADDDGRRLPFATDYKAAPYARQVQRLMRAAILEARRFRRHSFTAPPEWWEYEPLDVAQWSSDRNGYVTKDFLITVMDDLPNGNQIVGSHEIDPSDYDWDSDFELPWDVAPLITVRPAPQLMTGWQVAPATIFDNLGTPRRPSIEVSYDGGLLDVRAVRVQVRLEGTVSIVFDGEHPYDKATPAPAVVLAGRFIPDTAYEVRGRFLPFSGRRTEWSAWLDVTTDDIRLGALDIYAGAIIADLPDALIEWQEWIGDGLREVITEAQRISRLTAEQDLGNFRDRQQLKRQIVSVYETSRAEYLDAITVATGPGSALVLRVDSLEAQVGDDLAEAIELLETSITTVAGQVTAQATSITALRVAMGGNEATINVRMGVSATPSGYAARYAIQAAVNDGQFRSTGFFMDVPANPALPGRIALKASQIILLGPTNNIIALFDDNGTVVTARIPNLAAEKITAGVLRSASGASYFNLDNGALRVSAA